jgi:hypothetical protein
MGPLSAQIAGSFDPAGYVELALKTVSSLKLSDRRVGRATIAQQIALLTPEQKLQVTSALIAKLAAADINSKTDICYILSAYPKYWTTSNQKSDTRFVYDQFLNEPDESLKTALDSALANAKGLYRDAINDFSQVDLESLRTAESKLRAVASDFPKSRFAENASFYIGLTIINQYIAGDRRQQLIKNSNDAFEDYIKKVIDAKFGKKNDFFAAGYFYRGINGWIQDDLADARKWMGDGAKRFSDDDNIYIYQVILLPNVKSAVIDRFLPAKSVFTNSLTVLNADPVVKFPNADAFTKALAKM